MKHPRFVITAECALPAASLIVLSPLPPSDVVILKGGPPVRCWPNRLPQLWNVLRGDMRLISPRPEVSEFVDLRNPVWQEVLSVKPGITDAASLLLRDEERILARASRPEDYYRYRFLPIKPRVNLAYLQGRSFWCDLNLLFLTLRFSFFRAGFDPYRIQKALFKGRERSGRKLVKAPAVRTKKCGRCRGAFHTFAGDV